MVTSSRSCSWQRSKKKTLSSSAAEAYSGRYAAPAHGPPPGCEHVHTARGMSLFAACAAPEIGRDVELGTVRWGGGGSLLADAGHPDGDGPRFVVMADGGAAAKMPPGVAPCPRPRRAALRRAGLRCRRPSAASQLTRVFLASRHGRRREGRPACRYDAAGPCAQCPRL